MSAVATDQRLARPVVKWAGGKSRLADRIVAFAPEKIDRYVEPFAGGAALFFALSNGLRFRRAFLSDVNAELIHFYRTVRDRVEELIDVLGKSRNLDLEPIGMPGFFYKKDNFLRWRARDPGSLSDVVRAARFLYLNRTCFNGLYRVNKRGQFNVPFGRYTNPTICDAEGLRAASRALAGVSIECAPFGISCKAAGLGGGDLVYFDPPYDPVSETANFTSYTEGRFDWDDQVALASYACAFADLGAKVIASNADTPRIRELWRSHDFDLHEVRAARAINSAGAKRGEVGELIMVSR